MIKAVFLIVILSVSSLIFAQDQEILAQQRVSELLQQAQNYFALAEFEKTNGNIIQCHDFYENSKATCLEILAIKPNEESAFYQLAKIDFGFGNYTDAINTFDFVIKNSPDLRANALRGKGMSLMRLKDYQLAIPNLEAATNEGLSDTELYFELGNAYFEIGNKSNACEYWNAVLNSAEFKAGKFSMVEEKIAANCEVVKKKKKKK